MIRQLHITARFFSGQLELITVDSLQVKSKGINLLLIKNLATV
jgi:hypothetical protein